MNIFSLALRNARAKSGRGIIITIILTSMLISGVLNIGVCIQQSYLQSVVDAHGDAHAKFSNLTLDQIEFLENRVELEKYILSVGPKGHLRPAPDSPIAVPCQSANPLENDPSVQIGTGHAPMAEDEIALFPHTATLLGISPKVGDRIELFMTDAGEGPESFSFVISALFKEKPAWAAQNIHNLVVSEAFALKHAHLPEVYDPDAEPGEFDDAALSVRYRGGYDPAVTTGALAQLAGITNPARNARINEGYLLASLQSPDILLPVALILLLFVGMGALVIYNIFNIQLIRRVRQTGLLAVIGASRGQILGCVCLEALIQALVALPVGLLLGAILTRVSVSGVLRMAMPGVELVLSYAPAAFLAAALVTLFTVLISVLRPALRVSRVAPVDAVRFSGAAESKRRRRSFDEINLPRLSRINLWRNKGRTLVTVIALTLCGALFISVSTVGGSLLAGVETLARKGMAGDMQITLLPTADTEPLDAAFLARVSALDGVAAAHEVDDVSLIHDGRRNDEGFVHVDAGIIGYGPSMMGRQLELLFSGAPTLADMAVPGSALAVIMDEDDPEFVPGDEVQSHVHRWTDDDVVFYPVTLRIVGTVLVDDVQASAGIYSPDDFIMLKDALPKKAHPKFTRLAIDVEPEKHDQVAEALRQMVKGQPSLHFQSLKDAIEEQRNNMMGMLMLLYAIIAVLGLVGFLNLANTTLVGIEQRRTELGVLSALGVDGIGLRKLLWSESRRIATSCTVAAVVLGGALGYLGTLAMRNIGASYIRFTPPIWQSTLLAVLLFAIPFWITYRAGGRLSGEGTVSLLRVE